MSISLKSFSLQNPALEQLVRLSVAKRRPCPAPAKEARGARAFAAGQPQLQLLTVAS